MLAGIPDGTGCFTIAFAEVLRDACRGKLPLERITVNRGINDAAADTLVAAMPPGTANIKACGDTVHPCRELRLPRVHANDTSIAARSRHPGGVNVLFVGGNVRFLADSMSLKILQGLVSRHDGSVAQY